MEYFNIQPEETTLEILSRLPTESALECKLVCKNWRNIVSNHPLFSKMHLQHLNHAQDSGKLDFVAYTRTDAKFQYYEFDENRTLFRKIRMINFTPPFEHSRFLGSCNGLLCFAKTHTVKSVCICNPVIREYVLLPKIKTGCCDTDQCSYSTRGFGYVSSTNEYKLVNICMLLKKPRFVNVNIYTLGSGNGWRNLGKFNVGLGVLWGQCIFANGALYWMAFGSGIITTFDLAEEKFCKHLSSPPLPPENEWLRNSIGVLDGSLIFAMFSLGVEGDECYDIWLKKKKNDNHGVKELKEHQSLEWSKKFRVDKSKLLAITMSNGVLSCIDNYGNICGTEVNIKERFCQAVTHMNTLVSLKELGEDDTKMMNSVEIEETESRD